MNPAETVSVPTITQEDPDQAWLKAEEARLEARDQERDRQVSLNSECRYFECTDIGNARRLITRYGRDLRYCFPWGLWFAWNGTRWIRDDTGRIFAWAKDTVLRIGDEAKITSEAKPLFQWAAKSQDNSRINAMINQARPDRSILPDQMDASPNLLNCLNGTLDLDTYDLKKHQREDLCTKITGASYIPGVKCPLWESFLNTIFSSNKALIEFIQRAAGYTLTSNIGERAVFLCYGSGANGKSTLLNTLAAVLGDYARETPIHTFTFQKLESVRNDLAGLKGTRMVIAIEAGKGKRLDEALVKQLSGGDKISARFLYKEYFEYKPEFKIWWAFNHKPEIYDTTQSIWDRVKLIPFMITIPEEERDKDLPGKLLQEAPGILAWCLEGLREYRRIGLAVPSEVKIAVKEYKQEQDRLGDFLAEMCIEDPQSWIGSTDLYVAYQDWCNDNREKSMSQRSFGYELGDRYRKDRDPGTGKKGYWGLRLRSQLTLQNMPELKKGTMMNLEHDIFQTTPICEIQKFPRNAIQGSSRFRIENENQITRIDRSCQKESD